ncbi:hypothetical protein SMC26_45270 [Actinomadura fulvescens]|uniref:Uncharacterized protein n=1 Tax=Actinomadura fulvescens TaxID=46160 RepID=A0ABN3PT57_9ACTN
MPGAVLLGGDIHSHFVTGLRTDVRSIHDSEGSRPVLPGAACRTEASYTVERDRPGVHRV